MEVNHHNLGQSCNILEMLDEENFRRLYEASETGSIQNLKALIQKNPHILQKVLVSSWSSDQSPLHVSVSYGHLEFTRFLLDQKPELVGEIDGTFQRTPLHLAAANGCIEIVGLLLEKTSGPCLVRDVNGLIPLHYALIRGQIEMVQLLINARPQSVRTKLTNGQTVLHLCVMENRLEVIKFLIGLVFDDEEFLNTADNNGNNILDLAIMLRKIELIRYLLTVPALKPAGSGTKTMEMDTTSALEAIERGRQQLSSQVQKTSSCWKLLKKNLRYKGDWQQEVQATIMLVATMIATMTFQSSISPPGGVLQPQNITSIDPDISMAVRASSHFSIFYIYFLVVNTISFLASMNVILLIVSGLPLKNKICAAILKLIMCVAVVFLAFSFLLGVSLLNVGPTHLDLAFGLVWTVEVCSFYLIIVIVCVGWIIWFLIWVAKFLFWVFKRIFCSFIPQTQTPASASSTTT